MVKPRNISYFLSAFRCFTFILAVVQILLLNPLESITPQTTLLLGLVGVYSVFKVILPFRWYQKDPLTYFVVGADVVVCTSLPFLTGGGLTSPFLLYTLNPILTAALVSRLRSALTIAAISSIAVTSSHLFYSQVNRATVPVVAGEFLGILSIYVIICCLAAWLPFVINANVYRQIQEKATTEERNRLAQELHDNLAQSLAYLKLKTKLLKDAILSKDTKRVIRELSDIRGIADDLYQEARESIDLLRGKKLESMGLIPTLADIVHQFGRTTGIRAEFLVADGQIKLSPLAELHLMRIVQEALVNVKRHANARKVEVVFTADGGWAQVTIKDNGRGFNPVIYQRESGDGQHVGLKVMKERVEAVGGTMSIESGHQAGTKILLRIPAREVER